MAIPIFDMAEFRKVRSDKGEKRSFGGRLKDAILGKTAAGRSARLAGLGLAGAGLAAGLRRRKGGSSGGTGFSGSPTKKRQNTSLIQKRRDAINKEISRTDEIHKGTPFERTGKPSKGDIQNAVRTLKSRGQYFSSSLPVALFASPSPSPARKPSLIGRAKRKISDWKRRKRVKRIAGIAGATVLGLGGAAKIISEARRSARSDAAVNKILRS